MFIDLVKIKTSKRTLASIKKQIEKRKPILNNADTKKKNFELIKIRSSIRSFKNTFITNKIEYYLCGI